MLQVFQRVAENQKDEPVKKIKEDPKKPVAEVGGTTDVRTDVATTQSPRKESESSSSGQLEKCVLVKDVAVDDACC